MAMCKIINLMASSSRFRDFENPAILMLESALKFAPLQAVWLLDFGFTKNDPNGPSILLQFSAGSFCKNCLLEWYVEMEPPPLGVFHCHG